MTADQSEFALPCEGWTRGGRTCRRTTLDPTRTCPDHRNLAGHGTARTGTDEHGEWRVFTYPTPTGWSVRVFRVINGGDYGYCARRRYTKTLPQALAIRDQWAALLEADLSGSTAGGNDDR